MTRDKGTTSRGGHLSVLRHVVQVVALLLFATPLLAAGWGLLGGDWFGTLTATETAVPTPAEGVFFGTLSASSVADLTLMDPFAFLQTVCASKDLELSWLLAALVPLVVYGLIRGRAFCGWVCPINLLCEVVDALRCRLHIEVREAPVPRRVKVGIAAAVLVLSALTSIPAFEVVSPIGAVGKGLVFGSTAGVLTLVAIVVAELFWGHRVWCRSLCPLGGFWQVVGKVGLLNVKIDHGACVNCDACRRACLCDPAILEPALSGERAAVVAGDCMLCGKCVDCCPTRALKLGVGRR